MAGPWTYHRWLAATDVEKFFGGNQKRSTLLVALDHAIRAYENATATHRARALDLLWNAYDAWTGAKTDPTTSIRNKGGAVADLVQWMRDETDALMPVTETGFTGVANCYAYAMKCRQPGGGGTPVPGRAAHAAVLPYDPQWVNRPAYWGALLDGIVKDGAADGSTVTVLSQPVGAALPQPDNPPVHRADGTQYLAAMVVKTDGFHFLRRDSTSGRWTHKNGAQDAEVESSATLAANGRPVVIDDAVFVALVRTGQAQFRSSFPGFQFAGYVLVPNAGIAVS